MRRIIAACLLLLSVFAGIGIVLNRASTPSSAGVTTKLAKAQISASPSIILAGQCFTLTWNVQVLPPTTGHFSLEQQTIPAVGSQQVCDIATAGFRSVGIVLTPDDGTQAEGYVVPILIIPQDLRLWSVVGIVIGAILVGLYLLLPLKLVRRIGTAQIFTKLDGWVEQYKWLARVVLMLLCGAAAFGYFHAMNWSLDEVLHIGSGFVILWGGFFLICFIGLQKQIDDKIIRFTFSAIASYTLTTLFYFLAAIARLEWLYTVFQVAFWGVALVMAVRGKVWRYLTPRNFLKIDWILLFLILISMILMVDHKETYAVQPDGSVIYRVTADQIYNAGLSYELNRHIPPQQATIYAGMPERAYHLFPHLTTMLMARVTDQPDMLTAQVAYGYTIVELLLCLGVYSIVRVITKSRWAGYWGLTFVYILAVPWFTLNPQSEPFLFFTLFPFGINGLDLVSLTSPQMYASVPVVYGVMLGILLIGLRTRRNLPSGLVVIIVALMTAALLRFRIHFAIAMIPVTALFFLYWAIRKRRWVFLAGTAVLCGVTGILYLEMLSPVYLANTAKVLVQFNDLIDGPGFIRSFPFYNELHTWIFSNPDSVDSILGGTRNDWLFQLIGMTAFVLLNMIGIPSLLTFLSLFVSQLRKKQYFFFLFYILLLIPVSIVGAASLTTEYDNYSIGGQLLFHPSWYVLPVIPLGVWAVFKVVQRDLRLSRVIWIGLAGVLLVAFLIARPTVPQSDIETTSQVSTILHPAEWDMVHYIRDHTPQDAVIFSKEWYTSQYYIFSGTAGRVAYMENIYSPVTSYLRAADPSGDRLNQIKALLAANTDNEFCDLLWKTPITILVEYKSSPYPLHPQQCIAQLWVSQDESVSLLSIKPKPSQP